MKFFIDFEALQYSEQIISIGCSSEEGNTFQTYVKPPKGEKVSKFITELTGITNETLVDAPTADEAFNLFFDFIINNSVSSRPEYFCYGDADKSFLNKTLKKMSDPRAITFVIALEKELVDYSSSVKKYFNTKNNIALRKVYILLKEEDTIQKHDALEDAQMLQEVAMNLINKCVPEDLETIKSIPSQKKPGGKNKAPEIFCSWNGSKEEADTLADETSWSVRCWSSDDGIKKYFDCWTTASLWVLKYACRNKSPKNEKHIKSAIGTIQNAIKNQTKAYGFWWEEKGE